MSSFWGEMSWLAGSVQVPPTCSRTVVIRCACVCVCAAFQGVIPAFFAAQTTHSKLSPCATCLHLLNRSERSIRHINKDFLCFKGSNWHRFVTLFTSLYSCTWANTQLMNLLRAGFSFVSSLLIRYRRTSAIKTEHAAAATVHTVWLLACRLCFHV